MSDLQECYNVAHELRELWPFLIVKLRHGTNKLENGKEYEFNYVALYMGNDLFARCFMTMNKMSDLYLFRQFVKAVCQA